jgi:hypothetical protein
MKKMSTKSFSSFLSIPIGSVGVSISNVISWFSKNPFLGSTALVATSGILAYGIITFDLGKLAMSEDQLALGGSSPIVSHNGIIVERISDINKASETLSSLYKDPMMIACASEDLANNHLGRKKALKWVQTIFLLASKPAQSGSVCLQTKGSTAVAVWWPRFVDLDPLHLFISGGWQYFYYTGLARRGRLELWSKAVMPRRMRLTGTVLDGGVGGSDDWIRSTRNYYYLMLAAAKEELSPEETTQALYAVLLPVIKRADAQGVRCYVECTDVQLQKASSSEALQGSTSDRKSRLISIYIALGFREVEEFTFFNVPVKILIREPNATMVI